MRKFLILSLPRSRSKWLSTFLSPEGRRCGHDLIVKCRSVSDFEAALAPLSGSCETGGMVGWKLIRQLMPEVRLFVVRRPTEEVLGSFARLGFAVDPQLLEERAAMLDACSQAAGVTTIPFSALSSFDICKALFEKTLDLEMEEDWWLGLSSRNIQIDIAQRAREIEANRSGLDSFSSEVLAAVAKLGAATPLGLN